MFVGMAFSISTAQIMDIVIRPSARLPVPFGQGLRQSGQAAQVTAIDQPGGTGEGTAEKPL